MGRGAASQKAKPLSLPSSLPRTPGALLCTLCCSNPPAHSLCLSLELLQRVRKNAPKSFFYTALGSLPLQFFFPPRFGEALPFWRQEGNREEVPAAGREQSSPGVLGRVDPGIIKGWWAEIRQRISFSRPLLPPSLCPRFGNPGGALVGSQGKRRSLSPTAQYSSSWGVNSQSAA